jgi:hypothetical protein
MIKKFNEFNESISGTELVGPMGPNYGPTNLPTKPNAKDTDVVYSDNYGKLVTYDQYQEMYQDYLKKGGDPIHGFNLKNLEIVLSKLNESLDINQEEILDCFIDILDLGAKIEFDEDFDGDGTPCLEIELIGGYGQYKKDDCYDFFVDMYKISTKLIELSDSYLLGSRLAFNKIKNKPLKEKIKLEKYSELTRNQIARFENSFGLIVTDITFQFSEYDNLPSYPMFRIKFQKTKINELFSNRFYDEINYTVQDYLRDLIDDGIEVEFKEASHYCSIDLEWKGEDWYSNMSRESRMFLQDLKSMYSRTKDVKYNFEAGREVKKFVKSTITQKYFDGIEKLLDANILNVYFDDYGWGVSAKISLSSII